MYTTSHIILIDNHISALCPLMVLFLHSYEGCLVQPEIPVLPILTYKRFNLSTKSLPLLNSLVTSLTIEDDTFSDS